MPVDTGSLVPGRFAACRVFVQTLQCGAFSPLHRQEGTFQCLQEEQAGLFSSLPRR